MNCEQRPPPKGTTGKRGRRGATREQKGRGAAGRCARSRDGEGERRAGKVPGRRPQDSGAGAARAQAGPETPGGTRLRYPSPRAWHRQLRAAPGRRTRPAPPGELPSSLRGAAGAGAHRRRPAAGPAWPPRPTGALLSPRRRCSRSGSACGRDGFRESPATGCSRGSHRPDQRRRLAPRPDSPRQRCGRPLGGARRRRRTRPLPGRGRAADAATGGRASCAPARPRALPAPGRGRGCPAAPPVPSPQRIRRGDPSPVTSQPSQKRPGSSGPAAAAAAGAGRVPPPTWCRPSPW